jgi:CheY-like chemotaxis protein
MESSYCSCQSNHNHRRTILLVEDEPFVREATARILSSAGFDVLPAADANEACTAFKANSEAIDLVITDLVLPGRTGFELAEDLRRLAPQIDVLLTSGYPEANCDTDAPAEHMYFLAKPYSRAALVGKIESVVGAAR